MVFAGLATIGFAIGQAWVMAIIMAVIAVSGMIVLCSFRFDPGKDSGAVLRLNFYRRVFPRTYVSAWREHIERRNLEWILGPDPFESLPYNLRESFDLDYLLATPEERSIAECRQAVIDAYKIPPPGMTILPSGRLVEGKYSGSRCPNLPL